MLFRQIIYYSIHFLTTRVNYNPICNPYTKPGWLDLLVKLEALGPGQHELNCHELRSSNIRSTMHFERNCMHHMMFIKQLQLHRACL